MTKQIINKKLSWNSNSQTSKKEAELNTWFSENIYWQTWVEDGRRQLLDFIEKGERWDVWGSAQAGFESLDLMT